MSRKFLLFAVTLVALFFAGSLAVSAEEPGDAAQMFEVQLKIEEDGSWALPSFGGMDLGLSTRTLTALADMLRLDFRPPVVDPALLDMAKQNDIQTLALVKEAGRTTVLINNQPLSALTLSDEAVTMIESFTPGLEEMVTGLYGSNVSVGVTFPGELALDTSARVTAVEAPEPVNSVDLGVTISPDGQLLSVAGVQPAELGLAAPVLDISLLKQFGIQSLGADVGATGIAVEANESPLVAIEWNVAEVKKVPAMVTRATGMALTPEVDHGINVAFDWLQDSLISVSAAMADTPQESVPRVSLGRPIVVEVQEDNRLAVEGFLIDTGMGPTIGQYRRMVQSAALVWDGPAGRVRLAANDNPLPALHVDKEFLTTALQTFVGGPVNWDKVADAALNVDLTVGATSPGAPAPDFAAALYEPKPGVKLVTVMPKLTISRSEGSIALFDERLPLETVEGLLNLAITGPVRQTASTYAAVEKLKFAMGPSGIELGLNDRSAYLEWDDALRNNLIDLASMWIYGEADPVLLTISDTGAGGGGSTPFLRDIRMSMIKGLLGILNQVEIGVEVQLQDEPIKPGLLVDLTEGISGLGLMP